MRPYSPHFDEHYWSPAGGVTEKDAVFVAGSQLPARFAALPEQGNFCLAELGTGTGLTLALVAQCWAAHAPLSAQLTLISYEAYPLTAAELAAIHAALLPELAPWLAPLRAAWPHLRPGWQSIDVAPNIKLWLWVGEAHTGLPSQPQRAHAWLLDGFSPAKNPELWSQELCQLLARQSRPGATVATYSVARQVRDHLSAAGFTVRKVPGVPPKRDRLEGELVERN